MSPQPKAGDGDTRSAEERAEDLMERLVTDGSQMLSRWFGRAREEAEDMVAEARSMHERSQSSRKR